MVRFVVVPRYDWRENAKPARHFREEHAAGVTSHRRRTPHATNDQDCCWRWCINTFQHQSKCNHHNIKQLHITAKGRNLLSVMNNNNFAIRRTLEVNGGNRPSFLGGDEPHEMHRGTSGLNAADRLNVADRHILFGRGKGISQHPGNQRMRQILDKYRAEYQASERGQKCLIVERVYGELLKGGTKFLKRDDRVDGWVEVDGESALEKVGHCLRCARKHRQNSKVLKNAEASNAQETATTSTVETKEAVSSPIAVGSSSEGMILGLGRDSATVVGPEFVHRVDANSSLDPRRPFTQGADEGGTQMTSSIPQNPLLASPANDIVGGVINGPVQTNGRVSTRIQETCGPPFSERQRNTQRQIDLEREEIIRSAVDRFLRERTKR